MPALIPVLIAAAGAAAATLAGGGVIGAIVGAVVVTGLGLGANALFSRKAPSVSALADRAQQIKANISSNVAPIPVIYGQAKVGGQIVYLNTANRNRILFTILSVCEGRINGFGDRIYLDGFKYTHSRFKDANISVRIRYGTDVQTSFSTNYTSGTKIPGWSSSHRLLGVAAICVRAKYDADIFTKPPVVTTIVQGKRVYDPRDGSTAYSRNPALCIRDYLTNSRYGCGRASSEIDDDSFETAANYCDTQVTLTNGDQQSRYTCNGVVDTSKTLKDNMQDLLTSCRGMLVYTGGTYKLIIDKPETATFTFDEDNIIGGISIHQLGKREKKNAIEAHFVDPAKKYEPNVAYVKSATYLAEDNDTVLSAQIDLPFTNNYAMAKQIATMALKQSRQKFTVSFRATIEALQVEVGEVVYLTHSTPGWTAKEFRVVRMELEQNDEVTVEAVEYDADVYDLSTVVDVDPVDNDFDVPTPVNMWANAYTLGWLQDNGSSGTRTLNSAAKWAALAFIAPATTTLSKARIYINSKTGTLGANDLTCELQVDSSGVPSGTALQTSNTTTSSPSAGSFLEFTSFTYSLTKGIRYWLVFKNVNGTPASNYVSINQRGGAAYDQFLHGQGNGQWSTAGASTSNSGTNWSLLTGGEDGMYRLEFGDGTYLGLGITSNPDTTSSTGVYGSNETGAKFTTPDGATLRIAGVSMNFSQDGSPSANPVVKIYNNTTLLATTLSMPKENTGGLATYRFYFPLSTILEVEPETVLRVVLAEESNSDSSSDRYDLWYYSVENDATTLSLKPFGGTLQMTRWDGASWTDTSTALVPFGLVLDPSQPFAESE